MKRKKTFAEWRKEQYGDAGVPPERAEAEGLVRVTSKATPSNIAPVKEEEDRKWFEGGAFKDGYQFGDIAKTILGSSTDLVANVGGGALEIGESVVDAGAYLVGGAAKIFGADDFADDTKRFIAKDLYDGEKIAANTLAAPTKAILHLMGEHDYDDNSVWGEKIDSLAQSGGQLAGTIGLQAVGVPWFVTSGVTSFGSSIDGAFDEDASYGEAGLYGAISAGAEILTEKLFGGSGLGEKGLINLDGLTKGISNKVVKALADLGVDMAAEGSEEVVSSVIGNLGSALYKEENLGELLFSEEAVDEYIESFIGGAALGGIMNVKKTGHSIKTGEDYRSGLKKDTEEKVFNAEYEKRIAEEEKDGKKLTNKEKSKIYDEVMNDLEKGYISTDTIEEVLGGDDYKSYQDTVKNEDALIKELDELRNMKSGDMTDIQKDRLTELKGMNLTDTTKRDGLKTKLSEGVFSLAKGTKLAESYNEQARRGQAYEADLTAYDTKQAEIIKKAIDSKILNNTNRTHEFVDMVAKISADKGVSFDFADNAKLKESGFAVDGATINGYVTKDGITINIESAKSNNFVVGHEITHVLEGTELYNELQKVLFDYAKSKGDYQGRLDSITNTYKDIEGADVNAELTADLVGDYLFTDNDFVMNLSTKNRNVFQKIYDEIKYLLKVATAGSKEARELEKVKKAFEKAYKESGKTEGTKYSLSDSDGKQLTKEQNEYFKDSKMRDENGNLKVMYHGSQNAGFHVFDPAHSDDGISLFFVDRNDVATSYSGTSETYEAQTIRTAEDMNNFLAKIGYDHYEAVENNGKYELLENNEHVAWSDTAQDLYEEFCWYEGVGEGDANYKVYLNLTNPLEVDAKGRPWNKIDAEFSQEVYDKYNSLTAEEKAALVDLAEWEDFRMFNSEIQEARGDALASAYAKMGEDCNIYDLFSVAADNFSEESMRENARNYLKTRDYAQRAKEGGYDGVIIKNVHDNGGYSNGSEGASTVAIAFNSEQVKSVANEKPTKNPDIRYSLSDSEGAELSKEQQEYFKDSKIRNENGLLKVMHHGTNESFTVFDKNKARSGGTYGKGFYFTDSTSHAATYGESIDVYLNITNPLQNGTNNITKEQIRKFVEAIAENEDYGIDNYGYDATIDSVTDSIYGKSDFGMILDLNISCIGDMVAAVELFNKVNGTNYDGIVAPTETVAFYSEQIKRIDNKAPTTNPDIRYSLSPETDKVYLDAVKRGDMETAQMMVNQAAKDAGYTDDSSWKMQHSAPNSKDDVSLYDLKKSGLVPDDYWDHPEWYTYGAEERESFYKVKDALSKQERWDAEGKTNYRGKPLEARIWVYRAVDKTVNSKEDHFRNGDWVTPSYDYAVNEGQMNPKGYRIIKQNVSIKDLYWDGNSIAELGYDDGKTYAYRDTVNNRKLLDPVTYDDYGLVIPLSKRFKYRNSDTRYSLTPEGETPKSYGRWNVYGKDIMLDKGNIAPTQDTVQNDVTPTPEAVDNSVPEAVAPDYAEEEAPSMREIYGEDYAPIEHSSMYEAEVMGVQPEMNRLAAEASKLYSEGKQAEAQAILEQMQEINEATRGVRDKYRNLKEQESAEASEYLNSLTDADAPPEVEAPYNTPRGNITLGDNTVKKVTKQVRDILGLDAEDSAKMAQTIQRYAQGEIADNELFDAINKNFQYEMETFNDTETLKAVKKHIRGSKIFVPADLKADFNGKSKDGFNAFRKENMGRFTIRTKDASGTIGIDQLYQELAEVYPQYFPDDIWSPADQLQQIAKVAGQSAEIAYDSAPYDSETIQEVCDIITNGVMEYSHKATQEHLDFERNKFYESIGVEEDIAPTFETARKDQNSGQLTMFEEAPTDSKPVKKTKFEQIASAEDAAEYKELIKEHRAVLKQIKELESREMLPSEKHLYKTLDEMNEAYAREEYLSKRLTELREKYYKSAETEAPTEEAEAEEPKIAKVLESTPKEPKKGKLGMKIRNLVFDKQSVIEDISLKTKNRELMGKADFMLRSESRAQRHIKNKLMPILEKVEATGNRQAYEEYAYHLHNIDRMSLEGKAQTRITELEGKFKDLKPEQIRAIAAKKITDKTTEKTANTIREAKEYLNALETKNKPVFGDEVTADVSREFVKKFEAEHGDAREISEAITEYNNELRQMLVDAGIISKETADLWANMYPHYVPIRRAGKDGAAVKVPLDSRKTGVNAPIARAKGGNSDIESLLDVMGSRTEQVYRAVARNSFGVELMHTLDTVTDTKPTSIDEILESFENSTDELLKKGENGANPTFTVFEDGKRVTFDITEELYDALKPTDGLLKADIPIMSQLTKIQRGLLTQYNPTFILTNAAKDIQDVLVNSQHAGKTYANVPLAAKELFNSIVRGKDGKWITEYMHNGGEDLTYFDSKKQVFKKEDSKVKKVLGFAPKVIAKTNDFVEKIPRLAEYIASRKSGASVEVSMLDAARVTTNFAAGGDLTKFANKNGFTFLNASVQGFNQQVRNVREAKANGLKGVMQLAAKFAVAGLPIMLFNALRWEDDEEYEELSDYVKDNYYVVAKTEDGTFIRIPKGRAVAVIQNAFEQMENAITGDDEVDMERFGELMINNLAPNNPLENNVIAPIGDVIDNKTWYGDDLVPTRLQDMPAAEQYDETTASISKWLGKVTNTSPYKWNYVLDQYSGGIGDVVLPYLTPESDGDGILAPFIDKFSTDSVMKNQNVSDFYETVDELTKNANSMYATEEDILKSKYMNSISADLGELYQQKREIQSSNKSDAMKDALVRDIQEQINELTKESLNAYSSIDYQTARDGEYVNIGSKYFKLNDKGEWVKLDDDAVIKYKVTSAAGDANYASDGTNHFRWYEPGEDSTAEAGWRKVTDKELERQTEVTKGLGISPEEYWGNREEYNFAFDSPERYAVSKAVGGYNAYKTYSSELYDIKADKDKYGKSISGSRKEKVLDYINNLDADYGTKIILFKSEYNADDTYNYDIIDYLNSREDISYEEMATILKELGFTVDSKGNISWD